MKYNKFKMEGYTLHVIETNKFKTINVHINFKREAKKEDVTIRSVLNHTLFDSCKKYPTRKDLEVRTEELYGLSMNTINLKSGKYNVLSFRTSFLNDKYTIEPIFEDSIKLLNEIILNPNIDNNKFNQESFLLSKRVIKNEIDSIKDNPNYYGSVKLYEQINSESPISFIKNEEELDKITQTNLYEYYLDVIKNDKIDVFVIGNFDTQNVKEMFEIIIKFDNNNNNNKDNHYVIETNINDGKLYKEKLPINQTRLFIGYNFDSLTQFENMYVLYLLSFILGGSADSRLFRSVREKESLCYSINSNINLLAGLLIISSGIDSNNYEKTIELINKEIEEIKKGKISDEEIENGKKIYKNSCLELFDSPNSVIGMYVSKDYIDADLYDEKIKQIDKVTKEDIIKLINKMHINKSVLLEGDNNEKDSDK